MNLLPRVIENKPNILSFRQYQYDLIPEIFKLSFIYLQTLGFEFNFKDYKEDIIEDIAYKSINHFASRVYKIRLHKGIKDHFLHISLPTLIDGQFFKLNGALYVPGYFITDSPITVKKKSVLCYSLFNPITFYNGDNRVIFLGHNIPICRFLRLFLSEEEIELAVSSDFLDAKYTTENIKYSVAKLGEIVGGLTTLEDIKNHY